MGSRRFYLILTIILLLAASLRLASFFWNNVPHGYMWEDRTAAASFVKERTLVIDAPTTTPYFYSLSNGRFLDQHPPLWPVVAGVITLVSGNDSLDTFVIFKILSVIFGTLLVGVVALLTGRLIGREAGIWAGLFAAASYLLIDYSGNGALYIFQGFLYVAWLLTAYFVKQYNFSLATAGKKNILAMAALALVSALGLMTNYQAIALFAAGMVLIFFNFNFRSPVIPPIAPSAGGDFNKESGTASPINAVSRPVSVVAREIVAPNTSDFIRSARRRLGAMAVFIAFFVVFSSPLLIRNYLTFGSPLYTVNMEYTFLKAGIEPVVKGDLLIFPSRIKAYVAVAKSTLTFWLPRNLYYISRKLFILAPGLFIAFIFALIDYVFSRELLKKMLPILLVLLFHTVISAMWPITKFRYFAPLLPLVFIIGIEGIWRYFPRPTMRTGVMAVCFAVLLFFSFLTYRSTPGHTYYYDGAITTDPYGGQGELEWYRDNGLGDKEISD